MTKETILSHSLRLMFSGSVALGLGMLAQPVFAQASTDATAAPTAQPVQRVEITGSNIRRIDSETPSPVQVITADDMKKSGYNTVADVIRSIAANGAGQLTNSNSEAFAGGASGVALRGLSVGATLVLIDGHRMAPYPLADDTERQFTDITSIPFDAVERIEVLKDGASAVYGSDAIAGVVNVILKKSIKGTTVGFEGGTTQEGGGQNVHATFSTGFGDLEEDGYSGYVAAEFRHQSPIYMDQRPVGNWNSTNLNALYPNAFNLTPGVGPSANPLLSAANPTTPYIINTVSSAGASNYKFFGSGCNYTTLTNNQCTYINTGFTIVPETENRNLLVSFTKRLADGWELNVKASDFNSIGNQSAAQNIGSSPLPSFPNGSYGGATVIGPGQVPQFGVGAIQNFTIPANYPGNPFGAPAYLAGAIPQLGYVSTHFDTNNYRLVGDLKGNIGEWDIAASLGLTKVVTYSTYNNVVNVNALYNALNLPSNNVGFFNIAGGNSPYVLNSIAPAVGNKSTSELDFAEFSASRSLMALAGGDLGFAAGGTFVHKALDNPLPYQALVGAQESGFNTYAIGQENDASAYAEFQAPITKTLEIDGAGRVDHYDTYGTSVVPEFGFKWSPSNAIAFRGTAGEGFRAPNAAEVGNASSVFGLSTQIYDPVLCPHGNASAVGAFPTQCAFPPAYVQQTEGNDPSAPKLQPEKSKTWTLGTILEPVKGWSSTIDYYSIDLKNQIVPYAELTGFVPAYLRGAAKILPQVQANGTTTEELTPVGLISGVLTPYVNANQTKTTGVELETHYKWKLGEWGSISSMFDYNHMINYILTANGQTYDLAGTHGPNGVSGDTGNPKDRAQASFSWDKGQWDVTTNFNYVGSYGVTDPSAGNANTCQQAINNGTATFSGVNPVPSNLCTVGSFLTMDLTTRFTVGNGWAFHAGILNLLDRQPPVDAQTYGGGYYTYNPALHTQGAIGRAFNAGVTYHF